ncbi:MAG: hypothetical protein FWH21_06425 [Kiritimatiellaeota bacterium]|nr:hypothetical protein [Kiritimatiellota bacterium]
MKAFPITLSLFLVGSVISQDWDFYETLSDMDVARIRAFNQNAENLKKNLWHNLASEDFLRWSGDPLRYKQKFHVADDMLRGVLMEIIRESEKNAKWEPFRNEDPEELTDEKRRLYRAIIWLGYCADEPAKEFLTRIAVDGTKAMTYRTATIDAYLRCADAQQTRDALVRFLIGDMRIDAYSTYLFAMRTYDEVEDDLSKREAIVTSWTVALAKEGDKDFFTDMDKKLAQRSQKYAESSQRLAMIKRMSKLPPSGHRDTDNDLNAALESYKSRKTFTSVSTNLTELIARDFRKPTGKGGQ